MERSAHGVQKRLAAEERLPLINFMTSEGSGSGSAATLSAAILVPRSLVLRARFPGPFPPTEYGAKV